MRIDAHQHFWTYDPINYSWLGEGMESIRRTFMPEDLWPVLQRNNIDGSVLIQVNQTELENTAFLNHAAEHDFIKGVVGWIDFKAANLEERLHFYKQPSNSKMKGFRHIVQGEPDDFLLDKAFTAGVKKLRDFGFTYDILIFERQLKAALEFVRNLPDNKLVIDHIAKPDIANKSIRKWSNYMAAIARYENVFVKVSGMVTETTYYEWEKEDFYIYLDYILNTFGPKRIMYGSDWPVCLVSANYEEQLDIVQTYFSRLTQTEQNDIFGGNASRFYSL